MDKKQHYNTSWTYYEDCRGILFNGDMPTLTELFDITEHKYPENICFEAFVPQHDTYTYKQACEIQFKVARYLSSLGVKKGDIVGLTGKNSPEWAIAYFSILRCGASVAPIDVSLSDSEIEHLADFVNIKGLFVDGDRFERIGKDNKYGFKISLEQKGYEDKYILNVPDVAAELKAPDLEDTAAYLFTSGTTGTPKAVMLTHRNLVSNCFQAQSLMKIYPSDVFYAILPIHHAYTMLAVFLESVSIGAKLVFGKRMSINQIVKEMREGGVNMLLAVPMLYNKIISGIMKAIDEKGKFVSFFMHLLMELSGRIKKTFDFNPGKAFFSSVLKKVGLDKNRICICGGGPLPSETFRKFNQLGIDFVQGYGLTETSPILTLNPTEDYEETSVGKPLWNTEISFGPKDEQGNGEIYARGPQVMKGYYNNPEATARMIDSEGWLHTGDVGYMDKKGFVYITGRVKNIIVTDGGKNVFPEEIEDHFQLYEDVEQICICGYVFDKELKAESVAAIILPSSACLRKYDGKKEELEKHINETVEAVNKELLPYKRITKVIIAEEPMPMTSTRKIKRFEVMKQYKEQLAK